LTVLQYGQDIQVGVFVRPNVRAKREATV
jgi:hypothetical protein